MTAPRVIPLRPRRSTRWLLLGGALLLAGFGAALALAALGAERPGQALPMLAGAGLALAVAVFAGRQGAGAAITIEPERLTIRPFGRPPSVAWREVAEIVVGFAPRAERGRFSPPGLRIQLHAPSGAPVLWVQLPDMFEQRPGRIAAELREAWQVALARDGAVPGPGEGAAAAIAAQRRAWIAAALALLLLPLLLAWSLAR
jgi:hypothetical protein